MTEQKSIPLIPNWKAAMQICVSAYANNNSPEAWAEIMRCAELADKYVELMKEEENDEAGN